MWPFRKNRKASSQRRSLPAAIPAVLRARFDAAQTTAENARHWAMADSLSADSAAAADVRSKLRERARYEVANNSYAKGIVLTLANDCIGTGPRLQLLSANAEANRRVETAFAQWARAIDLAGKLRTMRMAKSTDGEAFAVLTANPLIDSPVMLDVQLVEADRVASPVMSALPTPNDIDGIILDAYGNPRTYCILREHPGDLNCWLNAVDMVDADAVVHWFRADRPSQHRGVPEITPALPLFAQLRRYTLAVIAAAETAADFAAVLFTDSPANGEAQALEPMDVVELEKRMATVLPDGWRLGQIEAQQPTTSYAEFKREILNEIARCLNLPYNIAACNSSGYNYASGRLDHQTYYKSIRVEQAHLAEAVLDRILAAWLAEAELLSEFAYLRTAGAIPHQWFFDGTEHVDPAKEATAQATRLASNTTTLAQEYARQGKDWDTELRQRAKEVALMKELGLTVPPQGSSTSDKQEADTDVEQEQTA
ncbi:MAG: Phage portal protein, lambda family [Planctomycetes bacterium ADurb.Bin126]|nr:MAG: Phage portal protein, lambda family [Planctomycetes bacterium ADurb.Bin126]